MGPIRYGSTWSWQCETFLNKERVRQSSPTWVPSKHGWLKRRFRVTVRGDRVNKGVPAWTRMQEGRVRMRPSLSHVRARAPVIRCAVWDGLERRWVVGRRICFSVGIVMGVTACNRGQCPDICAWTNRSKKNFGWGKPKSLWWRKQSMKPACNKQRQSNYVYQRFPNVPHTNNSRPPEDQQRPTVWKPLILYTSKQINKNKKNFY
jgi:hypothetical protein